MKIFLYDLLRQVKNQQWQYFYKSIIWKKYHGVAMNSQLNQIENSWKNWNQ